MSLTIRRACSGHRRLSRRQGRPERVWPSAARHRVRRDPRHVTDLCRASAIWLPAAVVAAVHATIPGADSRDEPDQQSNPTYVVPCDTSKAPPIVFSINGKPYTLDPEYLVDSRTYYNNDMCWSSMSVMPPDMLTWTVGRPLLRSVCACSTWRAWLIAPISRSIPPRRRLGSDWRRSSSSSRPCSCIARALSMPAA